MAKIKNMKPHPNIRVWESVPVPPLLLVQKYLESQGYTKYRIDKLGIAATWIKPAVVMLLLPETEDVADYAARILDIINSCAEQKQCSTKEIYLEIINVSP